MRRFNDRFGNRWEAIVGRGSWGSYVTIFSPLGGHGQIREAPLTAVSFDEATLELDRLDDAELIERLERAAPKQD